MGMTYDQALQTVERQSASLAEGKRQQREAAQSIATQISEKIARGERLDALERMAAVHYGVAA